MPIRKLLAVFAAAVVAACASLALDNPRPSPPSAQAIVPVKSERPLVALALGGGGARGFAHVGVIRALEDAGVHPDIVTGSSSGAIVAALYASGLSGAELERLAADLDQGALVDFSLFGKGWVRGEALQEFVNRTVGNRPIELLSKPFAVVATDAKTGRMVIFNRGETGLAVRASSSVPDLFIPPVIEGVEYVDGGLTSPVPVRVARAMGADVVIAVDLTRYWRSRELAEDDLKDADLVIRPDTVRTRLLDFSAKRENIAAGARAAQGAGPRVAELVREAARRKAARRAPSA
ncbi:MAG TPA: patatin-like phospholipase family protein [Burkholderiales bacterium]|nr:patatin-like phospholipase family protein [Burkholderiales bacterium]